MLNERTGLPVVAANLVVKTGSGANPLDKPGLANFTAAMLDEGTDDAHRAADRRSRSRSSAASLHDRRRRWTRRRSSARSLKRTSRDMLDAVGGRRAASGLPGRTKSSGSAPAGWRAWCSSARTRTQSPRAVMAAALYGPAHPYGFTEIGTEASNKAMSRDDMQTFWTQNFVPNNAALIVSGAHHGRRAQAAGREGVRRLAEGTPAQPALGDAATTAAQAGARRQAGRAADAVARRGDRRAAHHAGLRADRVMNEGARRPVLEPHQPESARGARLHLRRELAVRVPPLAGPFLVGDRRPHRRHRAGGRRDHEGAQAHSRERSCRRRS